MANRRASRRNFLAACASAPVAALLPPVSSAETRGIVGQMAPELDVEFWLDGQGESGEFSMLAQRGKWVYLKCWQSWCPGCHSHGFPALKKLSDAFADEPMIVPVGLQTTFEGHMFNTGDKVRKMQLRYDLEIPMGHDPGNRNDDGYPNTMRSYRTGGTPWQVVVNPEGRVVFNGFRLDIDKAIAYLQEQVALSRIG
ncbi:MAG: TlpA disulfide reductase family protein [Pseudomonadota bacterium]